MNEQRVKVSDWSQPIKIGLGLIALILLVVGGLKLIENTDPANNPIPTNTVNQPVLLGSSIELPYNTNSTGTTVLVKNIATEVLVERSGRRFFRLTNTSSNTISCVISSSTSGMVAGAGFVLNASSTANNYIDSGESNIEWPGSISCITSVTGTMATFDK